MSTNLRHSVPCRSQRGISLIIVMIMVVIIGLTSAAAIRNASSNERASNNIRMQNLSQQYAEAALRYCEAEVLKSDATRVASLKDAKIVEIAFGGSPAWNNASSWTNAAGGAVVAGNAASSRTVVPQDQIKSDVSSVTPPTLPQCVAERQVLADGNKALVITARAFSPDYTADGVSGATVSGSVVWLQSILLL